MTVDDPKTIQRLLQFPCFLALWQTEESTWQAAGQTAGGRWQVATGTMVRGIGASHQTGWTGLVAWFMISLEILDPKEILEKGFDEVALKIN